MLCKNRERLWINVLYISIIWQSRLHDQLFDIVQALAAGGLAGVCMTNSKVRGDEHIYQDHVITRAEEVRLPSIVHLVSPSR